MYVCVTVSFSYDKWVRGNAPNELGQANTHTTSHRAISSHVCTYVCVYGHNQSTIKNVYLDSRAITANKTTQSHTYQLALSHLQQTLLIPTASATQASPLSLTVRLSALPLTRKQHQGIGYSATTCLFRGLGRARKKEPMLL